MANTSADADKAGLIDAASNLVNIAGQKVVGGIFNAMEGIFNNAISHIVLALLACIWVYNKIGREWSREDFYKAGTWLIMCVCLKVIFARKENYESFIYLVNLPVRYFYVAVDGLDQITNVDKLISYSTTFIKGVWSNIDFGNIPDALLLTLLGLIVLLIIWLYVLFLTLFILLINLVCAIILSVCPIMLPCLIIPNFKGYFFSWLKLYTSTAIQPVFATIIGGLMTGTIVEQIKTITTQQQQNNFWSNPANVDIAMTNVFLIVVLCIASIVLLSKIPAWTQQLIGSGDGEHKTGIAGAISGAGALMKQGYKSYSQARNDMNYRTGGQNSIGRSLASAALSTMGMSGMAQKVAGQTGKDRQGYQNRMLQDAIQNGGFTATPTPHIEPKNTKGGK